MNYSERRIESIASAEMGYATGIAPETLMSQIEDVHKLAAMLCEEISRLNSRLSPVCQPEQSQIIPGAVMHGGSKAEPAPVIVCIGRLKDTLSDCDAQIRSIQMRLAV